MKKNCDKYWRWVLMQNGPKHLQFGQFVNFDGSGYARLLRDARFYDTKADARGDIDEGVGGEEVVKRVRITIQIR
jgi:hypothetical protein